MKNTTILAAAALLALSPAVLASGTRDKNSSRPALSGSAMLRGIDGEVLGPQSAPDRSLGGNFNNPFNGSASASAQGLGIYEITLNNLDTGWQETFLLGVPPKPLLPAPVLTIFHEYGAVPKKLLATTTYFQEAMARGWIVVAPLGAHKYNFGIEYSQRNVEAALDWVATYLLVDPERFYAVGFSMGGGAATSYATRHLDPAHPRFAAVVNHTGSVSMRDAWVHAGDKKLFESELMFKGTPDQNPFAYLIASAIDIDMVTGQTDQTSDMARNLSHIPVKNFAAAGDPLGYLVDQTQDVHEQLVKRGAASVHSTSHDTIHKWTTMSETQVLDYLEPITFSDPDPTKPVRTIADRNGRWLHFEIQQAVPGQLSPFRWVTLPSLNRLYVDEASNLSRISVNPADVGLDPSTEVLFVFDSADGKAVELALTGCPQPPVDVQRNGVSTSNWSYDKDTGVITLYEDAQGTYPMWSVLP